MEKDFRADYARRLKLIREKNHFTMAEQAIELEMSVNILKLLELGGTGKSSKMPRVSTMRRILAYLFKYEGK